MSDYEVHHFFTEDEYRKEEELSPYKREYLQGSVRVMPINSINHNLIAGNIHALLYTQLRGLPCRSFTSSQCLKVENYLFHTYSDAVVACPPFVCDPESPSTLMDATVIVEVLSPSTVNYDRVLKFKFYRDLPSFRHYILVAQDEVNVEHRFLNAESEWQTEIFTSLEDSFRLEAIGCILKLSEIYEDIENLG